MIKKGAGGGGKGEGTGGAGQFVRGNYKNFLWGRGGKCGGAMMYGTRREALNICAGGESL